MLAYKGFDRDLKCRGFQYEIGGTYEEESASLCAKGFHACLNPVDVLNYYPPATSRYCVVELDGVDDSREDDTKVAAKKITVVRELTVAEFIKASAEYTRTTIASDIAASDSAHAQSSGYRAHAQSSGYSAHAQSSGDRAHAQSSGYRAHAQSSGDSAHAQSSGYSAHAQSSGEHSIAVSIGINGTARVEGKAEYIVLAENDSNFNLIAVRVGRVGVEIERGKTYRLSGGAFVEVK